MPEINIEKQLQNILKEGFLEKQSRFLKSWRKRWFVLTPQTLLTFKQRKSYASPTQIIPLKYIATIKSCDDETHKEYSFVIWVFMQRIDTDQASFYIGASSNSQKEQWIGQIGKAMVKLTTK